MSSQRDRMLDGLPLPALLVDGEGRIVHLARSAPAALGATGPDDVLGSDLTAWVHEDDAARLRDALDGDDPMPVRAWFGTPGAAPYLEVHLGPPDTEDTRVVLLRDASADARFERLASVAADSILLLDRDGSLLRRVFGRLDPVTDEEVLGDNMLQRLHPEDLVEVVEGAAWMAEHPGRRLRTTSRARTISDATSWQLLAVDAVSALDDPHLGAYIAFISLLQDDYAQTPLGRSIGTSLAELVPIGILVSEPGGGVVYANAAARTLLGDQVEPSAEIDWPDAFDTTTAASLRTVLDRAIGTGTASETVRSPRESAWLRITARADALAGGTTPLLLVTVEVVDATGPGMADPAMIAVLLEGVAAPVAVVDDAGTVLGASPSLRAQLGERAGTGRDVADWCLDPAGRRELRAALAGDDEAGAPTVQTAVVTAGGPRPAQLRCRSLSTGLTDGRVWIVTCEVTGPAVAGGTLDGLTGLPGREAALATMEAAAGTALLVVAVVLDDLEVLNVERGATVGDEALRAVAERLRRLPGGVQAHRFGGATFVVVAVGEAATDEARATVAAALEATPPVGVPPFEPTIRLGSATGTASEEDPSAVLRAALAEVGR